MGNTSKSQRHMIYVIYVIYTIGDLYLHRYAGHAGYNKRPSLVGNFHMDMYEDGNVFLLDMDTRSDA